MKLSKTITRIVSTVFSVLFVGSLLMAQQHTYSDSWGPHGFSLTGSRSSEVEVNYSIRSFSFAKEQIGGDWMDVIELPGNFLFNDEGMPNLPGQGRYVAIPQGSVPVVEVTASRVETFTGINLAPAPRIPWESENGPLSYSKNTQVYSKDAFYPVQPVIISEVTQIRGVDVVTLGITPYQYNPVTGELLVYRDLKVKVSFQGGSGHFGEDRLRSRWWDVLLSDMLLNYESLPRMDYNKSYQGSKTTGCEYLIITPTNPEFLQWADSIKKFRTLQGILTEVMTVTEAGGNNANTLKNFFSTAYNTWDIAPTAVLLLGDYGTNAANSIISPIWNNYCVSDNIFADVSGNSMPDMVFARMTAQNATHLQTMVTKFLNYERTPPVSPAFYQNPITALGFQTERWFQICSESVAGFWEVVHGKTANRINAIYSGTPGTVWSTATNTSTVVNLFGPNGLGYIPASPNQVNCSWYGTAQNVITGVNNGAFMLQHRDHGFENGWGEPAFQSSHINSLNNTDLTFVWSVNCLTGKYNLSSECFAEKFHRHTSGGNNAGAVGINAASEISYSFVNDTYVWGAYDNMWPEFMPAYGSTPAERGILPAFANSAGKYFLQQSNWPYNTNNKEVTYNLFHHHGDAFLMIYSEVPQNLTVVHNPILFAGVTSFDVTANNGAFIALTVNGEIIGTGEATGSPVSITIPGQIPPNQVVITITKQNYYRYTSVVDVIPPSGPYVVQHGIEINDAAGNGNGIMETSETILASLTIENVGIAVAQNVQVTLSTADPYITITNGTGLYGNIAAGATATLVDGFSWNVGNNIPDLHDVIFEVNATDGNDTWTSYVSVQGHAPNLQIGSLTIDDSNGNGNGRLDPGENATIIIQTSNTGSYHAIGTIGSLVITSPYVTLNNSTHNFNVIGAGLSENAVFNVSVSSQAPVGTTISLIYHVVSGGYNMIETFASTIGLIVEDWETGDMGQFAWQSGGNNNWAVSTQNPYEGTYCVKSGAIGHNQNTWLSLQYEVFANDVISFMYKVSSENNYDFLKFYINNNLQGSWSGEQGWAEAVYPVTPGVHTFKWVYEKDASVVSGGDCAWIDYILLPAPPVTTAFAGIDGQTCAFTPYQTDGIATLFNLVNWTTSGNGTFNDPSLISPIYTPGTADVTNGSVTLTITAYGPDNTVSDQMVLTVFAEPTAIAGEDATVCSSEGYLLAEATAQNHQSVLWITSGDGSFDDNQILNPTYTPGLNDITNGSATLTFTAYSGNLCGNISDQIYLTIVPAPVAFAGYDAVICSDGSHLLAEANAENYDYIEWSTNGDGTFDSNSSMHPVYTPGDLDIEAGFVLLTMTAYGVGNCSDVSAGLSLTIEKAPVVNAGIDTHIAEGTSITIEDAEAQYFDSLLWTTSGDGSFDDPSIANPLYTPGANDNAAQLVVLTLTAFGNAPCMEKSDEMVLTISPLGIGVNPVIEVTLFPNPSSGKFNVQIATSAEQMISIKVYSISGAVVYEKEKMTISGNHVEMINLPVDPGVYFLKVEGEHISFSEKIIIRK
jgi:hypothetical protein